MTIEILTLVVTALFGFAGVAAAWYGRKSFRASKGQLVLAREQASRIPRLVLTDAVLLPLHADEDLANAVDQERQDRKKMEMERAEKQREEEERREKQREREELKEQKKRRGEIVERPVHPSMLSPTVKNLIQRTYSMPGGFKPPSHLPLAYRQPEPYEGPLPDAILELEIKNYGRATAYELTLWLTFEESDLEPVDHFAGRGVEVISEEDGFTVELRVQRDGGRLLQSENDWQLFRVPVLRRRNEGTTTVRYEITSPQGGDAKDEVELSLEVPQQSRDED